MMNPMNVVLIECRLFGLSCVRRASGLDVVRRYAEDPRLDEAVLEKARCMVPADPGLHSRLGGDVINYE
jgi:hypothetical protein